MFKIDTGQQHVTVRAQSSAIDDTMVAVIGTRSRAISLSNKIIEAIQSHECPQQLDTYWQKEDAILDALHLYDPHVVTHLSDIYQEHRAALIHGGAYQSAAAVPHRTASGIPPAQNGKHDKGNEHDF